MLRKNQKQVFTKVLIMTSIVALALTISLSAGEPYVIGKTYGEWCLEWFQCIGAIPPAENPLFSEGEVDLSIGQEGKVWFLSGSWVGTVERTGTVPANKALFFPVFNVWAYNDVGEEYTEEELREMAEGAVDLVSVLNCTVDGKALPISSNLRPKAIVRVQSPAFSYSSDVFGSSDLAVMDGYWVMLPPLSEGEHVIHFDGGIPEWNWMQDVTYNLTVVP